MQTQTIRLLLLVLAVFVYGTVSAAVVWKWVDKKGITHYSDQPVPGAVQVDLSIQTYDSQEATIPPPADRSTTPSRTTSTDRAYSSVEITSPTNEQTFTGTGGQISAALAVEPPLQPGHTVRWELDGLVVSEPDSANTSLQLTEVARGAHSLSASIVGNEGEVLKQSSPVTFYVHQTSVLRKKKP